MSPTLHKHVKGWVAAAFTAALLSIPLPGAAAQARYPDGIIPHSGPTISGIKILSADTRRITYVKFYGEPGKQREISAGKVKEITLGDAPANLRRAVSEYRKNTPKGYEKALAYLDKVPASAGREWLYVPYKLTLHADCLMKLGKHSEALPKYAQVIARYRKSFYFLRAVDGKAKAHDALKQYEEAAKTFLELDPKGNYKVLGADQPYGKLWQLRGRFGMANALAKLPAKAAEASSIYAGLVDVCQKILAGPPKELAGSVPEVALIHQRSLVGKAQVLMNSGKLEAARRWITTIENRVKDKAARLTLLMALGDLAMKAGDKATDPTDKKVKYKEALLAYMRVYILYPDQKAQRPRAMLRAGNASELLGTRPDNTRAVRIYKELVAEFPKTPEAKDARKRLEALGVRVRG